MFQVFATQELPSFGGDPVYLALVPRPGPEPLFSEVRERRASGGGTCALCVRSASGGAVPGAGEGVALWQIMLGGAALLFVLALI